MSTTQTGWTDDKATEFPNWDDVNTEAPPPLAPGHYYATIVKAEPRPTGKGDPAISLTLRVTQAHGEAPDSLSRTMYDNLTLTMAAAFRIKQLVQSVGNGVTPPPSSRLADVEDFCASLTGQGVWLRSKLDTYTPKPSAADPEPQPKTNAKVDRYLTDEQVIESVNRGAGAGEVADDSRPKRRRG